MRCTRFDALFDHHLIMKETNTKACSVLCIYVDFRNGLLLPDALRFLGELSERHRIRLSECAFLLDWQIQREM